MIKISETQLIILKILLDIPILKSLESKMKNLDIGKQNTWDQIIDP